jgi:hypothetical protein
MRFATSDVTSHRQRLKPLLEHLLCAPAVLIDLQLSVGFCIMTSKFLETFAIDVQPVSEVV